jgi:nucleotide-binding universal stress UspA family protein
VSNGKYHMKTILVPTDFSKPSNNAVVYAAEVAKITKAKLIILHVCSTPILSGDVPVVMPAWGDVEKDCMDVLGKKKRTLIRKYGRDFQIECVCKIGYGIEGIVKQCITEKNVDLVVMGMHGAGYLSEKLIGSVTTTLINQSECPVLIINEKVKFKSLKKIVLAYDDEKNINKNVLNPLKEFVKLFKSQVLVLNIVNEDQKLPSMKNALAGIGIEHNLEEIKHSYHFINNEDVINGINKFVSSKKADMIVMVPRKYKFLSTIFHERKTKKMAFHTSIPLLTLHE